MKKFLILSLLFIATCSSVQDTKSNNEYFVADDFIPTSEIVWCKANYKTLQKFAKILADDGQIALNNELDKYNAEQKQEFFDLTNYLQETVNYLDPEYSALSWKTLLVLSSFLDLDLKNNPDDYELLLKATSICTAWYNSMNS